MQDLIEFGWQPFSEDLNRRTPLSRLQSPWRKSDCKQKFVGESAPRQIDWQQLCI